MDDEEETAAANFLISSDEQEKREVISQLEKGANESVDDQTRSSLHTGDNKTGEIEPLKQVESTADAVSAKRGDADGGSTTPSKITIEETDAVNAPRSEASAFVPNDGNTDEPTTSTTSAHQTTEFDSRVDAIHADKINSESPDEPASMPQPGATRSFEQVDFTDPVTEPDQAPTDITLSNTAVAENADGAIIGRLHVADGNTSDIHSFTLSDDRFDVVDGHLVLKPGVELDHEQAAEIPVDITATDSSGASVTQTIVVDVLDVNEAPTSVILSNSAVAQNIEGAVVGKLTVLDPDMGESHEFSLSDDRFDVVEGNLILKPGVSISAEEASAVRVDITATDSSGASIVETISVDVLTVPDVSVSSGFHAQYFDVDHSLSKLDDIDWGAEPTHEEVTREIDYRNSGDSFWDGGSKDTFGVKINGNVVVEESGTFKFSLGGDDGAMLFVNGQAVIDNDGLHAFKTGTGEVELEPGTHHIEVRYFENFGHAGLKLEWEGPGIDEKALVTAPDAGAEQTISGVPYTVDLSIDTASSDFETTVTLSDLPEGTIVQASEHSATVDEHGSVDISGWDTDVLSIVPPTDFVGEVSSTLSVSVENDAGQSAVSQHAVTFQVNEATVAPPTAEVTGGFHASYFDVDHSLRQIDDINWSSDPTHEELVSEIDYANGTGSFWEGGSSDTFGAKLEGQITVEEGGTYDFFAGGDDGVMLYINGVEVIENDGLHGFRTRSGDIELEPGTYDIELRYFENHGHAGLKLEWEGPDTEGRELVRADPPTSVVENGTMEFGITLVGASEDAQIEISGLPADTILVSGEMSAVSDSGPVDLSGWDTSVLEMFPPPGFEGVIEGGLVVNDTGFNGSETSSTTSFSVTVGDAESASEMDGAQIDNILADDLAEQTNADNAWDSDPSQDDTGPDDDVMSEAAAIEDTQNVADLDVDTYERVDW